MLRHGPRTLSCSAEVSSAVGKFWKPVNTSGFRVGYWLAEDGGECPPSVWVSGRTFTRWLRSSQGVDTDW